VGARAGCFTPFRMTLCIGPLFSVCFRGRDHADDRVPRRSHNARSHELMHDIRPSIGRPRSQHVTELDSVQEVTDIGGQEPFGL